MGESNNDALTTALLEALPYINYFAGKTIVVKIGGSTLGSGDTTLQDIVWLKSLGVEPVIVHGGGSAITDWGRSESRRDSSAACASPTRRPWKSSA
jgi:hypothetical protein